MKDFRTLFLNRETVISMCIKCYCILSIYLLFAGCTNHPKTRTIYAGEWGITLNSDVYKGGGTDMTKKLQALLDKAPEWGRLHLILDGAALVSRSIKIHSNTTIECPDKSCGLFLADSSNCSVICNANGDLKNIRDHNITLIGGVYNNNSPGQVHHLGEMYNKNSPGPGDNTVHFMSNWVFAMSFYGVENFIMRDVTIANQRTFAMLMANWKYVTMENIHIDRKERADHQNQDGLHFFGPGRFLTLRNIYGNSGDDFIALAPDEHDLESSIEDVLIDGVHLEDADQGIRLLSRNNGKLDRVFIRNVTGTYRSYGFFVIPHYGGNCSHYGNIVFDMIDLRPLKNNYDHERPFLFRFEGNMESITLKNIYHHTPDFDHTLFIVKGVSYKQPGNNTTKIRRLMIDGLYVDEQNKNSLPDTYIDVQDGADIDLLSVKNVIIRRADGLPKHASLVRVKKDSSISELLLNDVSAPCLNKLLDAPVGSIYRIEKNNVE
ncbi:MAG: hypothetical protein LBC19_14295 [Tannerella sp.]|nr:hypothetical protein [Tannerella sp.]